MSKLNLLDNDNKHRTQDEAIKFHNDKKEVLISVADCFQFNDKGSVDKLRKDFDDYWLMTSTRIDYKNNTVTHHFDSKVVKPKVYKLKEIPVCQPTYLKPLLETKSGLEFVRALLDMPKASKQQIIGLFVALSSKKVEDIRFSTPNLDNRKSKPFRAVILIFDIDRFIVDGNGWIDYNDGLSRGVSVVSSAKQTKTKINSKISKVKYNIYDYTEEPTVTERLLCNIANELARKR